jgi:hypothetical protein
MTYCVAIDANIMVSTCPLKKGACLWQHRDTNYCKYTADEITTEEFCIRVGAVIDPVKQLASMAELKSKLTQ